MDFAVRAENRVKKLKEKKKKDKYLNLARILKKNLYNLKVTVKPIVIDVHDTKIGMRTEGTGKRRTSGNNPNYSIAEIGQNTEESPGELRRLAFTKTRVRNHRLTLVGKTRKRVNDNNDNIHCFG